ncbi:hypothetical protein [Corallococcus aberystwythensis]|uniref:Uncharacterized protein n=1 Tax=Corallococcus aberystwythensis TaxID=2316722 RepID=A0A3A8Q3B2_9BACT|nr:hypothetical protein [Corallococcus aberystwythensis]RKH63173.1 hypothetical protein D7W81_20880 [Corallococcus aberystwythensis]
MAVRYDPSVIQEHAEDLYSRASRLAMLYGFMGIVFGAAIGFILSASAEDLRPVALTGGAVIGVIIGASMGRSRAFALELQAQVALCQVATEANTRRTAEAAEAAQRQESQPPLQQVG